MNNWLRAMLLVPLLAGLTACGGGGGDSSSLPSDTVPTANFAFTCVDLACSFTSTSSDQDVGDGIGSYAWAFGDATAGATTANPTHTFAAAGSYDVSLKVADRFGISASIVKKVTVTAPPTPAAPHASFTAKCVSLDCTFTDTSTYDAGSVFQSRVWDFGDSTAPGTGSPATHTYAATTLVNYSVKLTVTDAAGKISSTTQSIAVSPAATSLNCVGGGCVLTLSQTSKVTATLVSHSCLAQSNQVVLTAPIVQTIFADGCNDATGVAVPINGGNAFAANTTLEVAVRSGTAGTSSLAFPPAIRVTGDFASGWTLSFDDGFGGAGEPDFNDLVILIKATP